MDNVCQFVMHVGQTTTVIAGILCFFAGVMVHRSFVGKRTVEDRG